MGIQDLQTLFESEGISVDLFRIGRNHTGGFRLVVDAEGCLDRLYGGYFSDWACGGQWARCVQFFVSLKSALAEHQVSVCICFNGTHPTTPAGATPTPPVQWVQQQAANRHRINNVLRHIAAKGTPPPKVWWVPPAGLHSCLRNALRHLDVPVMVSIDDHHQEVVGLCREKGYAGLLGSAGEYLAFQPPRYFCSSRLKLTYRSSLETKEYMVHDLAQWLEITQDKISVVAALLGNNILTEQHLSDFHKRLSNNQKKTNGETLVRSVANYVKDFSSKDLDTLCIDVFGDVNDFRCALLKQSAQYYVNGTKDGFLKYKNSAGWKQKNRKTLNVASKEVDMDTSRLASEANQPEVGEFKLGPVSCVRSDWHENINFDPATENKTNGTTSSLPTKTPTATSPKEVIKNPIAPFPIEVLRTCSERHSKGLMSPSLLTILMHRQITLPVLLEDENHREIPSIHHLFRPIRQNVYAILFNMHHYHFMATRSKEGEKSAPPSPVSISEWIYTRRNPGKVPEIVNGVMLDWPVPTVQRLWFGTAQDDKNRRIRAFLSCMRSENPLMTNTSYVPQHLLLLATVLRYIMTSPIQCLRRQELDVFLATAFAADLMNPLPLQEMTLSGVTVRGIQLGALLMTGIEAAILANDACGAPIWWPFTSPWVFFDGKLFQHKLARANTVKNLVQLCDNQVDVVIKVERMRKAILEGLDVEFAVPPLPMNPNVLNMGYPPPNLLGWGNTKNRGNMNTPHRGGGGRLEVAGVVVGQWGANYARSTQSRYSPQIGYSTYTSQQGAYSQNSSRGRGISRGRALGISNRGGLARRTRHRTTRPSAPRRRQDNSSHTKDTTAPINGKSSHNDDQKNTNGPSETTNTDALVDSTTDNLEQTSDNGESQDSQVDVSSTNGLNKSSSTRTPKSVKKTLLKGKKKGTQKTDSPAKCDDIKLNDENGQCLDNNLPGMKNKVSNKSIAIVNGNSDSNGDHKGQTDSALDE